MKPNLAHQDIKMLNLPSENNVASAFKFFQRSAHFDRRSRDLRERGYRNSERVTPRMHSSGDIPGPQRFDVLPSTGEL